MQHLKLIQRLIMLLRTQYDKGTNLYFMGGRDYDSKEGRFLVTDEYEGEDDNPVSFKICK